MNEPLSHVDYLAPNVQALLDERFDGRVTRLSNQAQVDSRSIKKILAGKPCRLRTIDKLAETCSMTISDMFLKPGLQTDWYLDAHLNYLSENLVTSAQAVDKEYHDVDDVVGTPHGLFKLYVEGVQYPQTNTLQKIAEALDIEVADLFLPPDGGD